MKTQRRRIVTAVLVLLMAWVAIPGSQPAEAQIPVTDIAHIAQSILQFVQQILDYAEQYLQSAYQYEQLYHDIQNLLSLVEMIWRDPEYLVGEFLFNMGRALQGSEYESLAYAWDDAGERARELYRGYERFGRSIGASNVYDWETYPELQAHRVFAEREFHIKTLDTLRRHQGQIVDAVIAHKDMRDAIEVTEGAQGQMQLLQHQTAMVVEELLAVRQLLMTEINQGSIEAIRTLSAEAEEQAGYVDAFSGFSDIPVPSSNAGEWTLPRN